MGGSQSSLERLHKAITYANNGEMGLKDKLRFSIYIIGTLLALITLLHYVTDVRLIRWHLLYRDAYFFVVILAGLWFGLRGALTVSLSITVLNVPFNIVHWNGMSVFDVGRLADLFLYNVVAMALGILRDRQKSEEERARESENLAAVGKAVSALAHDMKAPLTAIGGFSQLVKRYIQQDHPHRDKLDIIIGETRRLENMVKEMLDFSRPLELKRSAHGLDTLIKECVGVVAAEARRRKVLVKHESVPGLSATPIDCMRMKQALINLLMNAIQASPEGETVVVSCRQRRDRSIIDVIDCGCGIPLDQRAEIFMPFFTTKKDGTGLGLPIVRKIVEAHQGKILLLDNQGSGTIFRVILPIGRLHS